MTEKEAILQRHSVRKYEDKKIEPEKVKLIEEKIAELNAEGNLNLQFMEDAGKAFKGIILSAMGLGSAPSAIACAGEASADLEERVGYYGEKLVLYLQTLGLNTCWVGSFKKSGVDAEITSGEKVVIAIAVGYGKTQGVTRKSKTAEQVTAGKADRPDWFKEGVEMALLAPTAINQQKFLITLNDDDTVTITDKTGPYTKVDLGIVKCHFEIGAGRKI